MCEKNKTCYILQDVGSRWVRRFMRGLPQFLRFLENMDNKRVISDPLLDLSGIALKRNTFKFKEKTLKQIRRYGIGMKFAPQKAIHFMTNITEKILDNFEQKPKIMIAIRR